jgi:hypothetical protein
LVSGHGHGQYQYNLLRLDDAGYRLWQLAWVWSASGRNDR